MKHLLLPEKNVAKGSRALLSVAVLKRSALTCYPLLDMQIFSECS